MTQNNEQDMERSNYIKSTLNKIPPTRVTRPRKAHDLPLKNADNAPNAVNVVQLRG